jgi:hypothetical protein
MLATILKNEDGDFDYGPAFGALIFTGLALIYVWMLYKALKTNRIPFGFSGRYARSKTYWFECNKNSGWYWFAFTAYSLMIPFCVWTAYALCTGFFHKPD